MRSSDLLSAIVTGRMTDAFEEDVRRHEELLQTALDGSRILIVGGAGSIGAVTATTMGAYHPAALHVVDQNENRLAELIRDFRSNPGLCRIGDLRALPLDYGSPVMMRFLRENGPYDFVLNFSALKHVRSEKDVYSLTQMVDTNLVKHERFLSWIRSFQSARRYFCVSSDKAANPASLMGATKRLMEHLIFSNEFGPGGTVTAARFANVAFSDGSLLAGFVHRLEKAQPLAVPQDVRRFFISLREAGYICLLAAILGPGRHVLVPSAAVGFELRELEAIAIAFLAQHGFKTQIYRSEDAARDRLADDVAGGRYPLLVTPLDTSGEKPYEEFVGADEVVVDAGIPTLSGIEQRSVAPEALQQCLEQLQAIVCGQIPATKNDIITILQRVVPTLRHRQAEHHLDQRM
jgi:FlaA1/EpsC-like NDP-sugar epimerase